MELRQALAMHPAYLSRTPSVPPRLWNGISWERVVCLRGHLSAMTKEKPALYLLQALLAKGTQPTPLDSDRLRIADPGPWFPRSPLRESSLA